MERASYKKHVPKGVTESVTKRFTEGVTKKRYKGATPNYKKSGPIIKDVSKCASYKGRY